MSDKSKDWWDIAEICGKLLVPLVIAGTAWFLNSGINKRARAAEMTSIAVGVLSKEPSPDKLADATLRDWAISVLQNPYKDHAFSQEEADALRSTTLGLGWTEAFDTLQSGFGDPGGGDKFVWLPFQPTLPTTEQCDKILSDPEAFGFQYCSDLSTKEPSNTDAPVE